MLSTQPVLGWPGVNPKSLLKAFGYLLRQLTRHIRMITGGENMGMTFAAWQPSIDDWLPEGREFGPGAIADAFSLMLSENKRLNEAINTLLGRVECHFLVIDVRRRHSQRPPDEIKGALCDLLVQGRSTAVICQSEARITRLLFVGDSESLDEWEAESGSPDCMWRSLKKDVEFYVRALQSVGAAHYAYVGSTLDSGPSPSDGQDRICSAILALGRHYREEKHSETQQNIAEFMPIAELLEGLRLHVKSLFESAGRVTPFSHTGFYGEKAIADSDLRVRLLEELNITFQLGKRNALLPYSPRRELEHWRESDGQRVVPQWSMEDNLSDTSFGIARDLRDKLEEWDRLIYESRTSLDPPTKVAFSTATDIADLEIKLARYRMLRDLSRAISVDAVGYLGRQDLFRATRNGHDGPKRRGLFIIDDQLYNDLKCTQVSTTPLVRDLREVLQLAGWLQETVVARTDQVPADKNELFSYKDFQRLSSPDGLLRLINGTPVSNTESNRTQSIGVESYALILIDPDSSTDYVGPVRIQQLVSYLRRCAWPAYRTPVDRHELRLPWYPPIIVFSKSESAGNVQQSLNLGAVGYVLKSRPYYLLFEMRQALASRMYPRRIETRTASQFRALYRLKPHIAEKLRYTDGPAYVRGGVCMPDGSVLIDNREQAWIKRLPKADLHCHMGTCIPFSVVALLAKNTVGYRLLASRCAPSLDPGAIASKTITNSNRDKELLLRVARAVLIAESCLSQAPGLHPMLALAAGAHAAGPGPSDILVPGTFGIGDAIARCLIEPNDRCSDFLATAILVATITRISATSNDSARSKADVDPEDFAYFEYLGSIADSMRINALGADAIKVSEATKALRLACTSAKLHLKSISSRWDGTYDVDEVAKSFGPVLLDYEYWENIKDRLISRVSDATSAIDSALTQQRLYLGQEEAKGKWEAAWFWLKKHRLVSDSPYKAEPVEAGSVDRFTLENCVGLPWSDAGGRQHVRKGLQSYLHGADLLGSAHFQYPDNLLLAGFALVRDNARDNVVYCEVRCETTGYTKAGMSAQHATDLLRHSLDLASHWLSDIDRGADRLPTVRTNILLAAKRHKDERDARDAVALMQRYLELRSFNADAHEEFSLYAGSVPSWWRPSDVVGFDISGDESRPPKWQLADVLEPLARHSSPITIHAGEAANASSIWNAVYQLNATRIGHGLKLAEDVGLLAYCVREGICMEMCPNSNSFTNDFDPPNEIFMGVHQYPLRHYMRHGMEVTLATDNRYLHAPEQRTLTSEYLTAARLCGGLTRWELLQIVKAGFKNAFLEKHEVKNLLHEVEDRIYRIVARGWT